MADATTFKVGRTKDGKSVFAATPTEADESTLVWVDGESSADARPLADVEAGSGPVATFVSPVPAPAEGAVRDRVLADLGWDAESTAKMAAALHKVHPDEYPTPPIPDATPPS